MDNIIHFPRSFNMKADPVSPEQKQAMLDSLRQEMSDEITDDLVQAIMSMFHNYGLNITPETVNIKDCIFIEEVIRASVYRYKGISHFLHDMIDEIVSIEGEEEVEEEHKFDSEYEIDVENLDLEGDPSTGC